MNERIMTLQLRNENQILQELMDSCKNIIGKNLKAVVLFGSRASGTAKKDSDFDVLIIADDLPQNWRERPKARLYNDEIAKCHILRLGNNTWKIAGGIDV